MAPKKDDRYVLVSKYLAHQMEEDELAALEAWRKNHPEEFKALRSLWYGARADRQAFSAERAKQRLNQRIDALEAENLQQRQQKTHYWLKVAASISLLCIVAATAYFFAPWQPLHEGGQASWIEKSTGKSQIAVLTLPDGTQVKLNADSKISYSPKFDQDQTREVFLQGEAFFEVTHDPQHPFIVQAGKLSTKVLGTSFVVSAYPQDETTKVTVASGKVEVHLPHGLPTTLLLPGRQMVCNPAEKTWHEQAVTLQHALAWTEGRLVFHNATLSEVARVLGRYYDVRVLFATEDLKNCQLTASFEKETLFHVLDAIGYINDMQYTFEEGVVTLTGTGCTL